MTLSLYQQVVVIGMVVLGTVLTRFIPFLLFPAGQSAPDYVQYLGKVLPSAALGLLVVYCYRNIDFVRGNRNIPELAAGAVVVCLHVWRRSMILSIAGGTIFYMVVSHLLKA